MATNFMTNKYSFTSLKVRFIIVVFCFASAVSPQQVIAGVGCRADLQNAFPSVAKIAILPTATCTGIVVNPSQVITAAHCLVKDGVLISPDEITIHTDLIVGHQMLNVQTFSVHAKYEKYNRFDIAVINLKEPVAVFTKIASDSLASGDRVNIGGYGVQSISGYGPTSKIRNMGENEVDLVDDYYLSLKPVTFLPGAKTVTPGSPCILFFGDSGGGVIKNNKTYAIQGNGTRTWEKDGTIIHQDKLLRLDAPGIKEFLIDHLDASSWGH